MQSSFADEFNAFAVSSGTAFARDGEYLYKFENHALTVRLITIKEASRPVEWQKGVTYIFEDRWHSCRELLEKRLLAHLGQFHSVFARKCEIFRPSPAESAIFLNQNHIYGNAKCKYRYGLKYCGETVAVSTFSAPRPFHRGDRQLLSYEWIRFASLPNLRISGGMGRLLEAFIRDEHPEDIMSYADLEWSDGAVYEKLGFTRKETIAPVEFIVDPLTWKRQSLSKIKRESTDEETSHSSDSGSTIFNLGSAKYIKTL